MNAVVQDIENESLEIRFAYHCGSYIRGSLGFKGMYSCCRLKGRNAPGCTHTSTKLMSEIGDIHFQAGEINEALNVYSRMRKELSQGVNFDFHPGTFNSSGWLGLKGDKWECCGGKGQSALGCLTRNSLAIREVGEKYFQRGQMDKAAEYFNNFLQVEQPYDIAFYSTYGDVLFALKQYTKAEAAYKEVVQTPARLYNISHNDVVRNYSKIADVLIASKYDAASKYDIAETAIVANAHASIGEALYNAHRYTEAEASFQAGIDLDRNNEVCRKGIERLNNYRAARNSVNMTISREIITAIRLGKLTEFETLLNSGRCHINAVDEDGWTALIWACRWGRTSIVQTLLAAGTNLDIQTTSGDTALIWASQSGRTDIVHLLIQSGAHLNLQTNNGNTALIWAASCGWVDIVNILLQSKAWLHLQTNDGYTALSCARGSQREMIATLLVAAATTTTTSTPTFTANRKI